jgi:hypothetical protein
VGQERLGPSYFFIPLVIGPLNSLVWYVPSLGYTRGLGWRNHCGVEVTESSTNKQHIIKIIMDEDDLLRLQGAWDNPQQKNECSVRRMIWSGTTGWALKSGRI